MPTNTSDEYAKAVLLVRSRAEVTAPEWATLRARFAESALSDGLVEVDYENHDTPLGTVRVSATDAGIVRIILPPGRAEAVLQDLARTVSARILRTGTPAITLTRQPLDEYFDGRRHTFEVPLDWTLPTLLDFEAAGGATDALRRSDSQLAPL